MSAKTLICLKGNFEGLPVIQRAHALGHRLVVVDGDPNAPGFVGAEEVVCADHYSVDEVLNSHEFDEQDPEYAGPFDGVICCCGDMPHVAAALAHKFGLPGLTPTQALLSVDKLAQKTALRAAGLPVPDFWRAGDGFTERWMISGNYSNKNFSGMDFQDGERYVVKPADSRGARGVTLLSQTPANVLIREALTKAQELSSNRMVAIEEYLDGPQLSTESIILDGRVLFTAIGLRNYDRLAEFAPHIIEDGYDMPYGDWTIQVGVDSLLERACRALGWDNLTVKGDWIIHDGQLVILELAARLSGGFFGTHGIPLAYGVDFIEAAIRLALGEGLPGAPGHQPIPYVSQRYVFPAPEDIGRRVADIKWAEFEADFYTYAVQRGDTIAPVVSHGQRWGQATCTGATPAQARERAEQAVAAMKQAVILE